MKQVLQSLKTGAIEVADVPCPTVKPGHLLIRTRASLISAGTERMLIEFGKATLLEKARQHPERVRQAWDKVKTDGLLATLDAIQAKLDQPLPLGYCSAGVVIDVGEHVDGIQIGDRVVSNGHHAEVVHVPKHLCAKIPSSVPDEAATFTVLGAVSLQSIRLAQPSLGECFVVIGLGLVGLMTVQLLRAHGCRVLGIDMDSRKLALARQFEAEGVDLSGGQNPIGRGIEFSRGRGVDGVIIAASTQSSEPVHQAAQMCRKRGRIILVGVTGLEIHRADFYEKELAFQVSCSYGPGRYDPEYEKGGKDYPLGFVRWTAQRNFEAVLDSIAGGRLAVEPLISHRFPLSQAGEAYSLLAGGGPSMGIVLEYPDATEKSKEDLQISTIQLAQRAPQRLSTISQARSSFSPQVVVGVIGAGNFATQVLLPALKLTGVRLKTLASQTGVSGIHAGRKFGFEAVTTDADRLIKDPEINAVVIATRHDSHARFVCQGLQSGKHVFVEKPLALNQHQLQEIQSAYASVSSWCPAPLIMAGFNRRFSPHAQKVRNLLSSLPAAKSFILTVNAGSVPGTHWTQDPVQGGGRIVGEACHFIDLLRFLTGHTITTVQVSCLGGGMAGSLVQDCVTFTLRFADGSVATVHYLANGHKSFPKERLEVFCGGRILQLDNFRRLRGYGWPGFTRMNLWRQDKGHAAGVRAFLDAILQGISAPIPFHELVEVTEMSFRVAESAR